MSTQVLINLGCGSTYHPEWDNLDLVPTDPSVRQVNIVRGLPYPDNCADACYSSHVLEHLRKPDAIRFIAEQKRVLRAGGIIRVAVPDLEVICKNYLAHLANLTSGNETDSFFYDYTLLELFDQVTREASGGELYAFIRTPFDLAGRRKAFLDSRLHAGSFDSPLATSRPGARLSGPQRISRKLRRARLRLAESAVRFFLGDSAVESFRRGLFRDSGEVHYVMYDRFSLSRLLSSQGFSDIECVESNVSRIAGFASFSLEQFNGKPLKPDSLYLEAVKL